MKQTTRARSGYRPASKRAKSKPVNLSTYKRARKQRRQLPHILKHLTFIAIGASLMLLILWSWFHSQTLFIDAILLLVFCSIVDGLALVLQK